MKKDFQKWHNEKENVHYYKIRPFYHEREVWFCSLGVNIGFEQDGTGKNFDRPIVIVRGFNKNIFFGVALTGSVKTGKYYFPVGKIEDREASAILSQVRLIDTKRLVKKIMTLDDNVFQELKKALIKTLFI